MMLADPIKIRDAVGFDDMPDINAAIQAGLLAAEAVLAGQLGTDFEAVTMTDTFYLEDVGYKSGNLYSTEFKLSRGFVRDVDAVWAAPTQAYLAQVSARVDVLPYFTLDTLKKEKGVIVDTVTNYRRQFVAITYTAGFDVSDDNEDSYDLTQVPRWLQEAAKVQTLILLSGQKVMEQAGIEIDKDTLTTQLGGLIGKKQRYAPVAVLPL